MSMSIKYPLLVRETIKYLITVQVRVCYCQMSVCQSNPSCFTEYYYALSLQSLHSLLNMHAVLFIPVYVTLSFSASLPLFLLFSFPSSAVLLFPHMQLMSGLHWASRPVVSLWVEL